MKFERKGESVSNETIAQLRRLGDPIEGAATLLLAVELIEVRRGAVKGVETRRTATVRREYAGGVGLVPSKTDATVQLRGAEKDDILRKTPVTTRPRGTEVDVAGHPRTGDARPHFPNAAKVATRRSRAGENALDANAPKARPIRGVA